MRRLLLCFALLLLPLPLSGSCAGPAAPRYLLDAPLHRTWALVTDCEHPGGPWRATESSDQIVNVTVVERGKSGRAKDVTVKVTNSFTRPASAPVTLIAAGTTVHLWSRSDRARMSLEAVALDTGAVGAVIRVRLSTGLSGPARVLRGIVRGPDSVELAASSLGDRSLP